MIFQFGIVAIGMICGTILILAGHSEAGAGVMGAGAFIFVMSMVGG